MNFKTYKKMKNSGIEWIGNIPEEWNILRLGYCVNCISGYPFQSDKFSDSEDSVRLVRGDNVTEGRLRWDEKTRKWERITPDLKEFVLRENDILIGMDGSKVGKNYAIVTSDDLPSLLVQRVARLRSNGKLIQEFLYYLIGNVSFSQYIDYKKTNVAIPHMSPDDIKNYYIPIPSICEQKQISQFLNKETEKIDSQTQNNQKLIKLFIEKRQSIINRAVTKGLDPTVPMKDSGIEWIGKIPEDWKVKRLKFISKFNLSSVDRHQNGDEVQVLVCHYPEVYNNEKITKTTVLSEGTCSSKEFEKFRLKKDDVLITKDSETPDDIGVPAYIEDDIKNAVCGYHLAQHSTNKNQILGNFLFRFLQSSFANAYFETHAHGVTRFGLEKDSIGNIIISLPSVIEQNSISHFLDKETTKIDSLISKIKTQTKKLQEYRQSLISAAITGKIDIRNLTEITAH